MGASAPRFACDLPLGALSSTPALRPGPHRPVGGHPGAGFARDTVGGEWAHPAAHRAVGRPI